MTGLIVYSSILVSGNLGAHAVDTISAQGSSFTISVYNYCFLFLGVFFLSFSSPLFLSAGLVTAYIDSSVSYLVVENIRLAVYLAPYRSYG